MMLWNGIALGESLEIVRLDEGMKPRETVKELLNLFKFVLCKHCSSRSRSRFFSFRQLTRLEQKNRAIN